ncbi:tyrosine-type recombinase/integrase [Oerskovia turbata]
MKRATGYAWRVQARDGKKMIQNTFFDPDDPKVPEKAARQFARLVDRVGVVEATRIREERTGAARRGVPTLAEWAETYLDQEGGLSRESNPGTRAGYRAILEATILPRLGELPIDAITEDDVRAWMTWLESQDSKRRPGKKVAQKTVQNHHGLLSQILAAADARGLRKGNPARGMKATRQRKEHMTVLTQSEFAVLLHFIPEKWRPLVMWLAGTGMRWGEATALTWGDIDSDGPAALVHIDKAWQKGETAARVLGPPKTDAGERKISVPHELVAKVGPPARGDVLVFRGAQGGPVWPGGFYSRVWRAAVDAANNEERCATAGLTPLGKRPRLHDLRHSHVSWMIAAGRPLPYIQARLGHEKITTTIDTYGKMLPDAHEGDASAILLAMSGVLPVAEDRRALGA